MKPGNHTFLPIAKDKSGNITDLTSTACNNALCHNGSMSATEIVHQKELFNAAMDALKAMLQEKLNMYFSTGYPYFFTTSYDPLYVESYSGSFACSKNQPVKNWQTSGTSTFTPKVTTNSKSCVSTVNAGGTDGSGGNNMGAAFNYNLLYHDFGAFAHNRFYAKRLIFDSISWLYDSKIKSTTNTHGYFSDVEAAIQASDPLKLTQQQKNDACNYLFTSRAYTTYIPKDSRNWRPGSSSISPVY
ncbi:MAG: hypothetical protein PVSMB11_04460 [Desulfuromonadaceae bacterium]